LQSSQIVTDATPGDSNKGWPLALPPPVLQGMVANSQHGGGGFGVEEGERGGGHGVISGGRGGRPTLCITRNSGPFFSQSHAPMGLEPGGEGNPWVNHSLTGQ